MHAVGEAADTPILRWVERSRMLGATVGLSRRQRETVVFRHDEGLPVVEMATVPGVLPAAVSFCVESADTGLASTLDMEKS